MNHKLQFILPIILFFLVSNRAFAQSMTNDIYKLEPGKPSTPSESNQAQKPQQNDTKNETNYTIHEGFPLLKSSLPFTFSLSSLTVNFGMLNAGEPITRTSTISISNPSSYGYQIVTFENHPLKTSTGQEIPDTTCDLGSCTQTYSSEWINPLTYGFGYRCDNLTGFDCARGFENKTAYKQFANLEASEKPQTIMSSQNSGKDKKIQTIFKINIPGTQVSGLYQNEISYIAIPNY